MPLNDGSIFAGFSIVRLLGSGGMGIANPDWGRPIDSRPRQQQIASEFFGVDACSTGRFC